MRCCFVGVVAWAACGLSWEVGSGCAAMDDAATCLKRHACASDTCYMSHTHVTGDRLSHAEVDGRDWADNRCNP
jgi:hypothetical protein